MQIRKEYVLDLKKKHPNALVMVHPECTKDVRDISDYILSTGGMSKIAKEDSAKEFIVGTEVGIIHKLKKENPDKEFFPVSPDIAICQNMKKITLEKVLWALEDMKYEVTLPPDIVERAKGAVDRMVDITRD